ncbi:MAG: DUF6208 family protein [Xenococcaceae cyanobacterium]
MKNNKISLLWEILLALLSFIFYKVMKFLIGNLYTIYLSRDREKANQWRVLSQEVIDSPLSLPVLMTKGPRWNTHAIIGTLGPFAVKDYLELDVISANNSARSWIAIFYSFPGYETIDTIESSQVNSNDKWHKILLKPGKYTIGLRYYERFDCEALPTVDRVDLPTIKVDGRDFVAATNVPANVNDFYLELAKKNNWFYFCLHYYIFTILKLKNWLPKSFIKNEYLPVGATDTDFIYNFLDSGQDLKIDIDDSVFNNYLVYFTLYNRASLPVQSMSIDREETLVDKIDRDGFYLLRLRPKSTSKKLADNKNINWQIFDENKDCQQLKIGC